MTAQTPTTNEKPKDNDDRDDLESFLKTKKSEEPQISAQKESSLARGLTLSKSVDLNVQANMAKPTFKRPVSRITKKKFSDSENSDDDKPVVKKTGPPPPLIKKEIKKASDDEDELDSFLKSKKPEPVAPARLPSVGQQKPALLKVDEDEEEDELEAFLKKSKPVAPPAAPPKMPDIGQKKPPAFANDDEEDELESFLK